MGNEIRWDTAQIKKTGQDLIEMANRMFATLSGAGRVVDETKQSFDTPEGNTMRQMFASLSSDFSKFKQDVAGFGEFIDQYGTEGEKLKETVGTAARQLPGSNR